LGVSCGCVVGTTEPEDRIKEYQKDITYVSNTEIGFDYLRDNMKVALDDMCIVNRGFNFAIVDEVDSILIDESRTPLIISGPAQHDPRMYVAVDKIVKQLKTEDYEIDEKHKNVQLTESGNIHIEDLLHKSGLLPQNEELYSSNSFALLNFIIQFQNKKELKD
jgi:preprotein translocase subunit SecA